MSDALGEKDNPEAWLHPSPKLRTMRHVQVTIGTVFVAVLVLLIALASATFETALIAVLVVAAVGACFDFFLQRRVGAWAYQEREDDLLVRRGLMVKRLSVIPYGRMQYIDVTAGLFERPFGLASVRMYTAAAASDARIPGLSSEDAARLRDQLTAMGEARAAGL